MSLIDESVEMLNSTEQSDSGSEQSAIRIQNLSKSFGEHLVLDRIGLEIARGEMLVVLGPSGSGKTTLLRVLAGLEAPDDGIVELNGKEATHLPPQDRRLGVVFQEYALFQRMSVEKNIAFGLRVRRIERQAIRRRVDEMLELVRLTEHRAKYPSQLSGGQRQRVAVARALAFEPEAVLLDEPFSSLDAITRTELRREVRVLLRNTNIPALFITHDQEEALELGDRIAVLNGGRIEQVGTPFEVYNRPSNEFVATFLGAANVLLGRWSQGRVYVGKTRLEPPSDAPHMSERQPVQIVFRPEDVVLSLQPRLLGTPQYLGCAVVEEISYVGPSERVVVRLMLWQREPGDAAQPDSPTADLSVTMTRTKWEASDMKLSPGDPVVLGLRQYRLLPHYPLRCELSSK